jgi:hypothetical protein
MKIREKIDENIYYINKYYIFQRRITKMISFTTASEKAPYSSHTSTFLYCIKYIYKEEEKKVKLTRTKTVYSELDTMSTNK